MNVVNKAKGVWGLVDNKLKQIHRIASIENVACQINDKVKDVICADLLWGLVDNKLKQIHRIAGIENVA